MIKKFYSNFVLKNPIKIIILVIFGVFILGYFATKLEIDASSSTLLLDNDKDLKFARQVNQDYSGSDFLVLTYTPKNKLLSNDTLSEIRKLTKELESLEQIVSTTSILNVPLLQSPIIPIKELVKDIKTIDSSKFDKTLVKNEFLTSPLYRENLVSSDFKTTTILLNLKNDNTLNKLLNLNQKN
jgi:hypothetical protein